MLKTEGSKKTQNYVDVMFGSHLTDRSISTALTAETRNAPEGLVNKEYFCARSKQAQPGKVAKIPLRIPRNLALP